MKQLEGKVALVTGASRGVGRGTAVALGAEGAVVYVTGRTVEPGAGEFPGTIQETAQAVTARGGRGIAVACDHGDDAQIEALFKRIEAEQGRLDILVNNAYRTPAELYPMGYFWEKPLDMWQCMEVGARSTYIASYYAARLMVPKQSGLIVNTSSYGGGHYTISVTCGLSRVAADRMAMDMALELRKFNVAAVSLWIGTVMTERTRDHHEKLDGIYDFMGGTESPEFMGRVVVALATDPNLMKRNGQVYITAELAREYGVKDTDGSQPPSARAVLGGPPWTNWHAARGPMRPGKA